MRAAPTLLALVVALSSSLAAQEPSEARFYVTGGVELTPRAGDGREFSSQAGYFRQIARLGLRAGVAYYARHRAFVYPFRRNVAARFSTVAATFDITYDLSRTRVRPYLIGGCDVYRSSSLWRYDERGTVESLRLGVAPVRGAGLRFPLGTAEAFTELRLHSGSNAAFTSVGLPLTFGIRF